MVIRTAKGQRVVEAEKFFVTPAVDIIHMTVVKPEELLVAIRIPNKWAGAKFYFEKVADRNTWDFALVNVASALKVTNGTIEAARVACGGVSCTPRFIKVVEEVVKGGKQDEETAALAEDTLIFPDADMRKHLAIARDITSKERTAFAKEWNEIVGL